jgi:hypothetical protein
MACGHLIVPHPKAGQMAAPTDAASPSQNPLPTGSRPQMAKSCRNPIGQSKSALPSRSDVQLFSKGQGVIDLDSEISDGALDLGMAE